MNRKFVVVLVILIVSISSSLSLWAQQNTPPQAAIASAAPQATNAGFAVLENGGNAFDAAVAVAAALGVVEPYNSGFGGGGFWLLYDAKQDSYFFIDSREKAPQAARADLYLNKNGEKIPDSSLDGALSAGIPGEPAAMDYIAKRFGNLPLTRSLSPAIFLAEKGLVVDELYQYKIQKRIEAMQSSPAAAKIYLKDNEIPPIGYRIVQKDLARVMKRFAQKGKDGFYSGTVAKALVKGVQGGGGIWTLKDLQDYKLKIRKPLVGDFHGIKIVTAPPPSAGGVGILTMLNILSGYDLESLDSITKMQLNIEAMRRAYWDKDQYLDDPDFHKIPVNQLISASHADDLRKSIELGKATPSEKLKSPAIHIQEGMHTTHFSIIDEEGNRVAATLSLNYYFGSGFVAPGTGVLLNDQMDDFNTEPHLQSAPEQDLVERNLIAPGKRPLSSMSPMFLETPDDIVIMGVPGGGRIPTMLFLSILDFYAGNGPESWVSVPRYHHAYLPDEVEFEIEGLTPQEQQSLKLMGYHLHMLNRQYGDMQVVYWDRKNNKVYAASDPRRQGKPMVKAVKK